MKTYVLEIAVDEGYDEFWEDVAKGQSRTKVHEGIITCLADQSFVARAKVVGVIEKVKRAR